MDYLSFPNKFFKFCVSTTEIRPPPIGHHCNGYMCVCILVCVRNIKKIDNRCPCGLLCARLTTIVGYVRTCV